ncbi:MAG: Gfo/Idh/MocA family oxidoreductase [Puniceicoccales bacterium]|jgi:predicted dehydrogenase|nr:Gfo/Idh/MocA family oxidoreductase [Puniceicoccales bacterium]
MPLSRRTFLHATGALAAGAAFPAIASAAPAAGRAAPSETVNVALIGCNSMGWGDLATLLRNKGVRCLALCDVDRDVLARRTGDLAKRQPSTPGFATYDDYRRVLDRKDIDAVLIGTPDHWHCLPFVDACKAGKDIYVQKPLANSIAECEVMEDAARKYSDRVIQVGQQQRSGTYWKELIAYLETGAIGRVNRVNVWANFGYAVLPPPIPDTAAPKNVDYDKWLGPAPARPFNAHRFHGSWRMWWDYGGGLLTDWGVHLLDIVLWGMKVDTLPLRTLACGGNLLFPEGSQETYDTVSVSYQFKDFVVNWENNAGLHTGPYGKNYGIMFHGSKGYIVANRSGWEVFSERSPKPTKSVHGDGWGNPGSLSLHTTNFLECIKTRNTRTACTLASGSLCAKLAHLGNIGARIGGGALVYDEKARKFDVEAANKFLKPTYRAPWKFPQV